MTNQTDIESHKKILGVLYVVFSAIHIVGVVIVIAIFSSIIPIHVHDTEALMVLTIVKYAIISITVLLSVPALIAGIGLLYKKDWALTLAFVIGIIGILGFPIWTIIGIYSIVVFVMAQNSKPVRRAEDIIAQA